MLSYKIHHISLTFFKRDLLYNYYYSSGFGRQSRVIEFSVDECCIKDL